MANVGETARRVVAVGDVTPVAVAAQVEAPERALRGHMPALDGVRGLAILGVLVFHFVNAAPPEGLFEKVLQRVVAEGMHGVDLFFVLSGFLITGILIDASGRPHFFRNFYMRRLLRIFPLYYGVLVLVFFVAPLLPAFRGPDLEFLRERQGWAWLYAVNVYITLHGAWALRYLDHFWSLSVEEHFYFVWPFLVWSMRRDARRLMWLSLALSIGAMIARVVGHAAGISWWTTMVFTPFRLDGLALGGFLAILARQPGGAAAISRNIPRAAAVAAAVFLATYAWVLLSRSGLEVAYSLRQVAILVLLAALLMWALVAPPRSVVSRFFRSRTMVFLGTYSYGLYVYHHFLSYYMVTHRSDQVVTGWLGSHLVAVLLLAAAGIIASTAIAWASYEGFEKWFLSLKRLFESHPAAPAGTR